MTASFLPSTVGIVNLALVLTLALAFQVIGAALGGRSRLAAADLLVGWGATATAYTVIGALSFLPFHFLDIGFVFAVGVAIARVRHNKISLGLAETGRTLLIAMPLLLLVCSIWPSQWDELSHWLPNVRYLLVNDHFPGGALPAPASAHPGYPYGMPLAIYGVAMGGRLFGIADWTQGTAPVFNMLLLVTAARLIAAMVRGTQREDGPAPFPLLAAALLGLTLLCPTFVTKLAFTAYPDLATAVVCLGVTVALLPATTGATVTREQVAQLAVMIALGVLLKEDNIVPLVAIVGAASLWEWRQAGVALGGPLKEGDLVPLFAVDGAAGQIESHRENSLAPFIRWGLALLPAIAIFVLWHFYSAKNMPGGEMALRPVQDWRPELIPEMLRSIWKVAVSKVIYVAPMALLSGWGLLRLTKGTQSGDALGALAWIAGAAFWTYNLFLAFSYVTIFPIEEGRHAASLWRYNTHLGLLETAAAALFLAASPWLKARLTPFVMKAVIGIALVAPVAAAPLLRFDLSDYVARTRAVMTDVASALPAGAPLAIVDYFRDGSDCMVLSFQLGKRRIAACVTQLDQGKPLSLDVTDAPFLLINGWPANVRDLTQLSLDTEKAHLLRHDPQGWREVGTYPLIPAKPPKWTGW